MFKFLAALLQFLNRFLAELRDQRVRDEGRAAGRQEVERELKQEVEQRVEQAQAAADNPSPDALARMRSRNDRASRRNQDGISG